jgi:RNA polymerase sigma-70 factor (ECF subfamily)
MDFSTELVSIIPTLKRYSIKLTRNLTAAADLLQDTLLKALERQHQFTPGTNLAAWTSTIMFRVFLEDRRRERRVLPPFPEPIINEPQHHELNAADTMAILLTLPPAHQDAVLLVGGLGHTYEEAAEMLGANIGTIKSRVHRARSALHGLCRAA